MSSGRFGNKRNPRQQQQPAQRQNQQHNQETAFQPNELLALQNNTSSEAVDEPWSTGGASIAQQMGVRAITSEELEAIPGYDDATITSVLEQLDLDTSTGVFGGAAQGRPQALSAAGVPMPSLPSLTSSSVWAQPHHPPQHPHAGGHPPLQHPQHSSQHHPQHHQHPQHPQHHHQQHPQHPQHHPQHSHHPHGFPPLQHHAPPAQGFAHQPHQSIHPLTQAHPPAQVVNGVVFSAADLEATTSAPASTPAPTPETAGQASEPAGSEDGEAKENGEQSPPKKSYFRQVYVPLPDRNFRFMSKTELSIIIRQSLQQLQTKNPMDDDFYYQVYTARAGGPWKGVGFPGMEKLVNRFRNSDGSPIIPDGTLGRVAVSSIRKPRKLVNLVGPSTSSEESTGVGDQLQPELVKPKQFMFAHRSLDYVVEEGLRCIMDVEDVDNLLFAVPSSEDEARQQQLLQQQRASLGQRLMEHLGMSELVDERGNAIPRPIPLPLPADDHLVFKYGSIPKGRNLLVRALMMLSHDQVYRLLHVILHRFHLFAIPAKPSPTDISFPNVLEQHLRSWMPQQVTGLFNSFMSQCNIQHIVDLARSKAGNIAILSFCERGHQLRSNAAHTPPQDIAAWMDMYVSLFKCLAHQMAEIVSDDSTSSVHEDVLASEENRWRILADLSSHASPQLMSTIQRSEAFILRVHSACAYSAPARFFASLIAPLPPPSL